MIIKLIIINTEMRNFLTFEAFNEIRIVELIMKRVSLLVQSLEDTFSLEYSLFMIK